MGLSLHLILRTARQWWWLIGLLPIVAGAAAYHYGTSQPDRYAASATVLVSTQPTSGIDFGVIQGNRELAVTYQQLVSSWPVLEPVIAQLGLPLTLDELQDMVSSSVVPNTSLISITVSNEDPDTAAAICAAVTEHFREFIVLQAGANNVRVNVAVPARLPTSPYAPRIPLYVIFGVATGLLLAMAVLATASLRASQRAASSRMVTASGGPILGVIPYDRRLRSARNRLFFLRGVSHQADEAVRAVRARILPLVDDRRTVHVLVSASKRGEGASTLASNLALALAHAGTPTVLVDANLRAPGLEALFGSPGESGLADLLTNQEHQWTSVARNVAQNLVLLPAGGKSRAQVGTMDVRQFGATLNDIRVPGGVVLIDAPPALGNTDTLAMARACDGVIVIGTTGARRSGRLRQAVSVFLDAGIPVYGVVLRAQRRNDPDVTWHQDDSLADGGGTNPRVVNRARRRRQIAISGQI